MAIRTLKDWLKAKVADHDVSDLTLQAVLLDNGVDSDTLYASSTERQRDLCLADIYISLATSSTKSGSIYDSDGGWQKGRATKNVVDRGWFRAEAERLYAKWNSDKASSYGSLIMRKLY